MLLLQYNALNHKHLWKIFQKRKKKQLKALLKKGILRRHAEWLRELRELLDQPYDEETNEFDRSMTVTDKSRKFYKEAMRMEDYYRNSMLTIGLANLLHDGYLTTEDIASLHEDLKAIVRHLTTVGVNTKKG